MTLRTLLADLEAHLAELRIKAKGTDDERAEARNEIAALWNDLDAAARDMAALRHDLDTALFDVLDEKVVVLPGIGTYERGFASTKERFEADRLLELVLTRAAIDAETGERVIDEEAIARVRTVLETCLPITPSLGWRKTGLTATVGDMWKGLHSRERGRKTVRRHG
jgi:hypothetical protein